MAGKFARFPQLCSYLALLLLTALPVISQAGCLDGVPEQDTYDYIVTGSGPGGGPIASNLARNGYSVVLIEAGDDQSNNPTTVVPALGVYEPRVTWDFYVRNYDDLSRTLRHTLLTWRLPDGLRYVGKNPPANATLLGVYYPRGATLGGSSIINAMATWLPSDSDWDYIVELTGDDSWKAENMRDIFVRIEKNNYLAPGTPGHGFDGWLQTVAGNGTQFERIPNLLPVYRAMAAGLGENPEDVIELLSRDGNYLSPTRDQTQGVFALPFHATGTFRRFSSRDLILSTANATNEDGTQKYPLKLQLSSLATRVLFSQDESCLIEGQQRAIGVEYLQGASLYKGDPRHNPEEKGTLGKVYARKEVIISGGTFNSPQLLQLSGIGPKDLLNKFNITVVSDLPGVGTNLQDNQEMPIIGLAKQNFTRDTTGEPNCTYGAPGDPCLDLFYAGQGPYSLPGVNSNAHMLKTNHSVDGERDILIFAFNDAFRGFSPLGVPLPPEAVTTPNTFGMSMVKIHPQNRAGTVMLRSADPQDTPDINFHLFSEGGETDLGAMADAVAYGRRVHRTVEAPVGPLTSLEPPCASINADGTCSDPNSDKEWIQDQTFGHHPSSTCAIGADDNPMAVLDSKLRVRGVQRLRVVDASVFPRLPGAFPAVSTFMVSERATDFVLADACHLD